MFSPKTPYEIINLSTRKSVGMIIVVGRKMTTLYVDFCVHVYTCILYINICIYIYMYTYIPNKSYMLVYIISSLLQLAPKHAGNYTRISVRQRRNTCAGILRTVRTARVRCV